MDEAHQPPAFLWRLLRALNGWVVKIYPRQKKIYGMVLLLTTRGRKSGLPRITPLQYEAIDGTIYIGSARGQRADWYRNILADANVTVQIGYQSFSATAQAIDEPQRIANFLETRLQRHPRMIRMMLLLHGQYGKPERKRLEKLGESLALVVIHSEGISV